MLNFKSYASKTNRLMHRALNKNQPRQFQIRRAKCNHALLVLCIITKFPQEPVYSNTHINRHDEVLKETKMYY